MVWEAKRYEWPFTTGPAGYLRLNQSIACEPSQKASNWPSWWRSIAANIVSDCSLEAWSPAVSCPTLYVWCFGREGEGELLWWWKTHDYTGQWTGKHQPSTQIAPSQQAMAQHKWDSVNPRAGDTIKVTIPHFPSLCTLSWRGRRN